MSAVFITGATSGIGKQLALDYAKQGWQVVACGRNQPVLDSLQAQHANIFPWRLMLPIILAPKRH